MSTQPGERQSTSHLEIIFENPTHITADIIFVHGLRGHRTETWTKGNICWPRDLLPKEEYSNVRILSFGYDSRIIDPSGQASLKSLLDNSISLLKGLYQERKQDADRPIIFVAHSLGGLIVKDALIYSERHHTTKPDLASILLATRGIIFFGTPHRGSGTVSLAKSVALVVQAVQDVNIANVDLICDLERESQMLDRIRDGFCQILDRRSISVFSFVEELAMLDGRRVVDVGTGIINDGREHQNTIHADHVNMVKFSDPKDDGYGKVLHALEQLLKRLPGDESPLAGLALQDVGHLHPRFLISGSTFSGPVTINTGPDFSYTNYGQHASGGRIDNYYGKSEGSHEATTFYEVPSLQVPNYVERKTLFCRLEELLERCGTSSLKRIVVLFGMGGTGKTQLALRYCQNAKYSLKRRAVLWLDACSRNALYLSMEAIAKKLLPGRIVDDPREAVSLVTGFLSRWTYGWLLVFDNLDNPSDLNDIRTFFPDSNRGSILVTSRCAGSTELGHMINVDRMEENEGLQLLLRSSQSDMKELAAAQEILTRLEYLPLAIDQVRAYTSCRQLPLMNFLDEYERRKHEFMAETPRFSPYLRMLPDLEQPTTLSLLTTWEMSFDLLDVGHDQEKLGEVLMVFAFFHPFSISEGLFSASNKDSNFADSDSPLAVFMGRDQWDHQKFERAIVQLREHSLLQFSLRKGDEIVVTLHSMVSEWLRVRLNQKGLLSTYLQIAASHLKTFLKSTYQTRDHAFRREVLSHIDTICQFNEEWHDETGSLTAVYHEFGVFYAENARLQHAERMYNRALAGYEKAWGPNHTSTLSIVNNLGLLYADQGRFADAERMYSSALAGKEKTWGPDHTSTLDTVNNLGNLYRKQGHLVDAERMYNRALAGKEKALEPDHTSTLDIVNNLGLLYADQGRLADAETMYNRALAGYEKVWGPDHTSTLRTVNNLGLLYADQGRLADAEKMYNRALAGKEKTWGLDHTSTLDTVNNLGLIYADQGRLADAERMYNRALAGKEKTWGPDHTSTLNTINNLGFLYADQGRLADAERMYNRALAGYEKAWGPDHASILNTVNNLGNLYADQGRLVDAESMYRRALAGKEKVRGPDHTSTLDTVDNLGLLYADQGRLVDAERMYNRALAGYEKVWGPDHTSTLNTVNNLGLLYAAQGRLADAEKMYNRALAGYKKA